MKTSKLGLTDIQVSRLCFGGNVFGWTTDESTSFALLDGFLGAGLNFIDTADVYSKWVPGNQGGESETVLGKWFKRSGKRKQVILATKVGIEMAPDKKGLSKAYILRAVEDSLQRLQTDYIDLYQSHTDDATTPLEETLGAYAELTQQGKVRVIGASNYTADRLAEALEVSQEHGLPRYQCLQHLYNLYDRATYEAALEPLCLKEHLSVIPYFSLASGFLTGKYRSDADLSKSPRGQRMIPKYMTDRGFRILEALDQVAKEQNSTPAKVSLAWLMARPGITAPIASATNLEQLNDLIDSTRLELNQESIQLLDQASEGAASVMM
jgi:aryl-alcohol dehydrogenase-like predicted oxidoreductase